MSDGEDAPPHASEADSGAKVKADPTTPPTFPYSLPVSKQDVQAEAAREIERERLEVQRLAEV